MSFVDANFWSVTEPAFYELVRRQLEAVKQGDEEEGKALLSHWRSELERSATRLFDQYALSSWNEDGDLRRVIHARDGRRGLLHKLRVSKPLKQLAA